MIIVTKAPAFHRGGFGVTVQTDRLVLIVVGAHLRAEAADRPIAYALRDRLEAWLTERGLGGPAGGEPRVLVCTDLWFLNAPDLRGLPAVSVGGPGVNALAAHWAGSIPAAFAVEGVLAVQFDPDAGEPVASCWGADARATADAVDAFVHRCADRFMTAATRRW